MALRKSMRLSEKKHSIRGDGKEKKAGL